ncbi:phenylalanine--tRNA ligase beta subunit-related protein [Mesobacillus maritimus]|uniref:B3/B4 domain-containing protein n=1 Tax=Mesobacillus maritimus TaxID=1643336 RepID=UPI00203BE720|nr:phenylalanine--tRNA ligase beta subunit-related protein [Mesobacillus maritimus]MCM3588936.1 phenylalanine--tRNA ligase beta subunit-related protein [Mesobacillus maritimus]MCM3672157.1 phenylalanine--tRNA ligase beta subunit-related protein [Mesobacillus maritimus]
MEIMISSELCRLVPGFTAGIIRYRNIEVGPSPQMLKGRLQLFQESIYFDLEDKNLTEFDGIKEWRQIFKQVGKDPNRYRHSAEALYRRIKKQNYLQSVHSAIDTNNFFSLKYEVPIGIYDMDKVNGDIEIKIGNESEEYIGLNGRVNSLANLIVSKDELGPFGSPFVDSERTAVSTETKNALQIIYLRPSLDSNESQKLTESLMNMFLQIHGGEGHFTMIGCE